MIPRYIVGIDFSITCPAICIYSTTGDNYYFEAWVHKNEHKKMVINKTINNMEFKCTWIDRKDDFKFRLPEAIVSSIMLRIDKDSDIGIEDYAYSGSGQITKLAESAGLIKYLLYEKYGYHIKEISISQGKMMTSFDMKGNTGKGESVINFIQTFVPNLLTELNYDINDMSVPVFDWVDAFGICKFVYYYHRYNNGEDVPEKIKKSIDKSAQ